MRSKPEAPATLSSSLLDFGFISNTATPGSGSSSPSKLDVFTKRFKETMVDIINTDFTQPATSTGTHSPQGYYTPPRGQAPVPLQQQQQLQQRTGATGPVQPVTLPTSPAPSPEPLQMQPQQQQQHGEYMALSQAVSVQSTSTRSMLAPVWSRLFRNSASSQRYVNVIRHWMSACPSAPVLLLLPLSTCRAYRQAVWNQGKGGSN